MPKHTYTELVAAGAPELPIGYVYLVQKSTNYNYTVHAVKHEKTRDWSKPWGYGLIKDGDLNIRNIVKGCKEAHRDLTDDLKKNSQEDEWLGVYR